MANLLLLSAEDHLRTMLLVRNVGPLPQFALYTVLRAAGEAAVRARHLLDPKITETQRLARALNERLENLIEQRNVDRDAMQVKYDEAVDRFEKQAIKNGIPVRRKKNTGPICYFWEPIRPLVHLFGEYLPEGSAAFRLLSGFTHSRPWVQVRPLRAEPSTTPGLSNVPLDMDVVLFSDVLTLVLALFDEDVALWLDAAGYPPEVWKAAKHLSPQVAASPA